MIGRIDTAASFVFILTLIVSCATTIPPALLTCKDEPVIADGRMCPLPTSWSLLTNWPWPVPIAERGSRRSGRSLTQKIKAGGDSVLGGF